MGTLDTVIYVTFLLRIGLKSTKRQFAYCSTEQKFTYFYTKYLQGSLFAKFCDMIMKWKHVDTLQIRPPSTKDRVENVVKV